MVHAFYYIAHGLGDGAHCYCGLDAGGDGIDAGGEFEEVELFILLAYGILGVDAGDIAMALLDCLEGELRSAHEVWEW